MISADFGGGYSASDFSTTAAKSAAATTPRFLTGFGQRDTHALTLENGQPNQSPAAGLAYRSISWDEIRRLVDEPAARPKEQAQFVILSAYFEHDGRTHEVQRERGEYWGLAVDIDRGGHALAVIEAAVRDVAPRASAMIYSSSSATAAEPKWRVLLELARPIPGADYKDTQEALFDLFAAWGIICDRTLSRTGQPIFLPNVPPEKRAPDGRPAFYRSLHLAGQPLDLSPGSLIVEAREAHRARDAAEAAQEAQRAAEAREARQAYIEATGDDFDPVEHFNATTPLAATMRRYEFKQHPRRKDDWSSPRSESGSFSTRILPATEGQGEHWVAFSAWAKSHNVGRESRSGYRFGDAFDLFVHFDHGDNRRAAVLAHVQAARPDLFAALEADPRRREDFLTWAAEGRRRTAVIERLADRGPIRSIDEMRQEIAAGLIDAIRRPPAVHLFCPATGTGKTTLALEAAKWSREAALEQAYRWDERLAEAEAGGGYGATCPWPRPRKTWPWGATCPWPRARPLPTKFTMSLPTHANVREVEQAASRLGLAPAAYPERNERNCGNIENAAKAAGMGLNVFAAVCESCPVAAQCKEAGYLAAVKEANASACKIGTHDRAVVAQKMTEKAEAIIVDEDLAKALAPTYSADTADVRCVMRWAEDISKDLCLDGRSIDAAIDDQIFAAALADTANRIMLAVEGLKVVDGDLTAEQKAAAQAEKDAALRWQERGHQWAAGRLAEAKADAARLRKRLKEVSRPGGDERLAGDVKSQAAQAAVTLKQRSKQARAAAASLKRVRARPLTSFPAGRPTTALAAHDGGRVIKIDLPAEVPAPNNWSELVFRWAERYGPGRAISPEARKIVMLAATGGLEALWVVEAAPKDNQTAGGYYAFAKGKTAIPRDRTIIALDATADAEAIRAMTGREVIDHTPAGHVALAQDAIQFAADLTASTSPAEAASVVTAILERLPQMRRIGIIGWRKAIAGLREELEPAARERIAKTAYFWEGPDRGSNDWIKPAEEGGAGCDLLIVLGTPRPGTEPVRKMLISMGRIAAAGLLDGDWGPRRWEGRRPDGRPVIVEGHGYRHPEWHRAYCLIVRSMLLQAIGRARSSLTEGIPVVAVTIEPTGLPAADPLPILGTEVRQTVDLARNLVEAGKRNASSKSLIGSIALRGWLRTADLIAALTLPAAVRKQSRKAAPGLSKRAGCIRIERAVAAGRLVRGPRGWVGIAGETGPWPASASATSANKPSAASSPAAPPPAAGPAVSRPPLPAAQFDIRTAAPRSAPPIPVSSPDFTHKEQTWPRMTLTKTG